MRGVRQGDATLSAAFCSSLSHAFRVPVGRDIACQLFHCSASNRATWASSTHRGV